MVMKFTNNATTTLASGITNVATSLTVAVGTGSKFPSLSAGDYFYCTLANLAGTVEIIKVTAISGDTFTTIVRGQDGTTALSWNTGDRVELRLVAASLNDIPKLDEANNFTIPPKVNNTYLTEEALTSFYSCANGSGYQDLYRSGELPLCFNQQWGGAQWGGDFEDGSKGSVATGNVQDDTSLSVGASTGAGFYRYMPFKVSENMAAGPTFAIKLNKTLNPVDNFTLAVYSDNAGVPNAILGTAATLSGKQITSKADGEYYLLTPVPGALTAGTQYHLVASKSGGADASNYYNIKATTRSAYPFGVSGTGTNVPAWASVAGTAWCFRAINPAANSIIQSGGMFDYKLAFNNGTPWDQSRAVYRPLAEFYDGKVMTYLHRGTYATSSNVVDYCYGIDHDRITLTINSSGYPVLTIYRQDRTAYTITGTGSVTSGNHDVGFKVRTVGDGADYATLYVDGVSVGTPLTSQTFTMDSNFRMLGTRLTGAGFGLAPTWTQDMQMTSLPSAQGWTWTGTGTEANCMSIQNGKLYQNANGYTSTQNGYYTKTTAFNNATGWTVSVKVRVPSDGSSATNQYASYFQVFDGSKTVWVSVHEYYVTSGGTGANDFYVQGDFKSQDRVFTLCGKGSDYYLFIDGKLAVDGTGKLTGASASNSILFGDNEVTASINADAIWSYVKYYQGGMILPAATTGTCSEFAHWSGDKSALLPTLWNSGSPLSVKQVCGVPRNYQYEAVVQREVRRGVQTGLSTSSTSAVVFPDMEAYIIGSQIIGAFDSVIYYAAVGPNYSQQIAFDGAFGTDEQRLCNPANSTYNTPVNSAPPIKTLPLGLHKVEGRWLTSSGTVSAQSAERKITVEARA